MTALKSRVRKKQACKSVISVLAKSHDSFDRLSKVLSQVIAPDCRQRIMEQIRIGSKGRKDSSEAAFINALKDYINFD